MARRDSILNRNINGFPSRYWREEPQADPVKGRSNRLLPCDPLHGGGSYPFARCRASIFPPVWFQKIETLETLVKRLALSQAF